MIVGSPTLRKNNLRNTLPMYIKLMKKQKPVQPAKKNLKTIKGILIIWLHMKQWSVRTVACRYGEFVETLHSSLRKYEETHGFKIVRKKGTPTHETQAKRCLTSYNSRRAGFSPAQDLTLRRNFKSPASSPLAN